MTHPRILLDLTRELRTELFDQSRMERLESVGTVLAPDRAIDPAERLGFEIVVTGWGSPRFPDHRGPGDALGLVAHSAGTVRRMVPKSLLEDGVQVSQAASGMAVSVAELALYMTLAMMRRLDEVDRRMRARNWYTGPRYKLGKTIAGSRIGVVGASRVGRAYIEHIAAMGAEVLVYDPYLSATDALEMGVRLCGLDDLMAESPVVALHAPVTDETIGMIDARRLALIPDGGIVINTARSAILDWQAFLAELVSGRLLSAMDVFDTEPIPDDDPLWTLPNVMLTPHIGAWTTHSRVTQGEVVVDEIERYVSGASLVFEVDADTYDRLA